MSRRMNEGDAFQILNGRIKRQSGRPRASLAALQWAAERAGQSYGIFTQRLTQDDEARIQEEYEKQREASVDTSPAAHRVENESQDTEEFIITDDV